MLSPSNIFNWWQQLEDRILSMEPVPAFGLAQFYGELELARSRQHQVSGQEIGSVNSVFQKN